MGGPGRITQLVADRDGETAVVGPDEADDRAFVALNLEAGPLAAILRPSLRGACEKNKVKYTVTVSICSKICSIFIVV